MLLTVAVRLSDMFPVFFLSPLLTTCKWSLFLNLRPSIFFFSLSLFIFSFSLRFFPHFCPHQDLCSFPFCFLLPFPSSILLTCRLNKQQFETSKWPCLGLLTAVEKTHESCPLRPTINTCLRGQAVTFFCAVYRGLQPPFIMLLSDDKTSGASLRCHNRFFYTAQGQIPTIRHIPW